MQPPVGAKCPFASMGLRGTDFFIALRPDSLWLNAMVLTHPFMPSISGVNGAETGMDPGLQRDG